MKYLLFFCSVFLTIQQSAVYSKYISLGTFMYKDFCFLKVCVRPLYFHKRLTLVHAFANPKLSEENLHFYKKRHNAKIVFWVCFTVSPFRGRMHPKEWEWPGQAPFPGTQWLNHLSLHSSGCVCEHQCFILTCFPYLLARCALKCQNNLREVILGSGSAKMFFHCKLIVIASPFYTISVY